MAFSIRRLSVLAYANGFTLWHYTTGAEAVGHAETPRYFDGAADMLAVGDILMVSGAGGARMFAVAQAVFGELVIVAPMC